MDLETSQVAARHFVRLPIDQQQRGAAVRSTDRGGNYPIQADFGEKSETATTNSQSCQMMIDYFIEDE